MGPHLSEDQETTFVDRDSGAPIGKMDEFDDFDIEEKDENGNYIIPEISHVHLARKSGAKILRRSFSYASGIVDKTGAHDDGYCSFPSRSHRNNSLRFKTV